MPRNDIKGMNSPRAYYGLEFLEGVTISSNTAPRAALCTTATWLVSSISIICSLLITSIIWLPCLHHTACSHLETRRGNPHPPLQVMYVLSSETKHVVRIGKNKTGFKAKCNVKHVEHKTVRRGKKKSKNSLCLIKHSAMKTHEGVHRSITLTSALVVTFKHRPSYPRY